MGNLKHDEAVVIVFINKILLLKPTYTKIGNIWSDGSCIINEAINHYNAQKHNQFKIHQFKIHWHKIYQA